MAAPFDDLLFIKFTGYYHHYLQEVGLEVSLITLAARSDDVSSNPFSFQVRKSLEMLYTLHCVARASLNLARKTTKHKNQQQNPLAGERWQRIIFARNLDCTRTVRRGTHVQEQKNVDRPT